MLDIYVDADSCPVKDEILKVANRYDLEIFQVSNQASRPTYNPKLHLITVSSEFDASDDWIAEHVRNNDIVITADILLAERCVKQQAIVIKPNGQILDQQNIGSAVAGRALSAHLRELGNFNYNNSFSKNDRSNFLQSLDKVIQKIKS